MMKNSAGEDHVKNGIGVGQHAITKGAKTGNAPSD